MFQNSTLGQSKCEKCPALTEVKQTLGTTEIQATVPASANTGAAQVATSTATLKSNLPFQVTTETA